MDYEKINIPLNRLILNNENDRHGSLGSEIESIQWMLENHEDEILALARDVAAHGLSPIDGILVMPHPDNEGDFIVWEGNRRVTALKLLDDPNRCPMVSLRAKLSRIANALENPLPKRFECVIAPSVEEADRLIELRHQGPQGGVGTLPWTGRQKTRHQERLGKKGRYSFSHQVIDTFADKLDPELREKIAAANFAISTVDRLLKNQDVRHFLGLTSEDGIARRFLREAETVKGLSKILGDVADGMPVREVYTAEQQREYIKKFPRSAKPKQSEKLKDSVALDPSETVTVKPDPSRPKPRSTARKSLIPSECRYGTNNTRLSHITKELKSIDVEKFRNATSVLFRVFLELSCEQYLDSQEIAYHEHAKLDAKLQKTREHMKKNNWLEKRGAVGAERATSNQNLPFSIRTFHEYVHNLEFEPTATDLKTAWDNLQPFFDALFAHCD